MTVDCHVRFCESLRVKLLRATRLRKPAHVIFEFIRERTDYAVAKWVKYFQVSRSGYYNYIEHLVSRQTEVKTRKDLIKKLFNDSSGTYGPDRICGVIRESGGKASYRKISRYMADMGLKSIHNRHKVRSLTDSRKSRGEGFVNYVRGQTFDKPRQAVCSDITYLKCGEGWDYMCIVKDIVSGEILGEASSSRMTKELVIRAFTNAHARSNISNGTIYHSDRGSQYTSKDFMDTLKLYGIKQSFSRVGMPGDNSWAESFFATLKKECINFKNFTTRDELREVVFAWIEGFYNSQRVQARLGYISPRVYFMKLMEGVQSVA